MVQLRLGDDGAPRALTLAQRPGAQRLDWDQVETADSADGPVAVIYPARGSHTPLARTGSHEAPVVPDHNDGLGPRVRPRLETISDDGPGWALWPGRWGSTRRREHFEGDSPRGPSRQPQWWDPAALHAEASAGARAARRRRGRSDAAAAGPAGRQPGGRLLPLRAGGGEGAPARIVAAGFGPSGEPGHCHPFAVEARRGEFALQLSADREWRGVRVAVTDERGLCGETVEAVFE